MIGGKPADDVLTVVLDAEGAEALRVRMDGATPAIKMPLGDVLQLAGVSLEDQLEGSPNALFEPDSRVFPGPVLRLTGLLQPMALLVRAACRDWQRHSSMRAAAPFWSRTGRWSPKRR